MLDILEEKKEHLKALRLQHPAAAQRLDDWYDVELTYTSNAIEGNTLTRDETAIVIEQGITVHGKSLVDHNEAKDHHDTIRYMRGEVSAGRIIDEKFIRDLHGRVTASTLGHEAGLYSQMRRRVTGSMFVFPNPVKLPELMDIFGKELSVQEPSPQAAFDAHLRLVSIHPFSDGNGRTARLLLNAILLKGEYCPLNITPEQRPDYMSAIRLCQEKSQTETYNAFMMNRLDEVLDDSISMLDPTAPDPKSAPQQGGDSRRLTPL